MEGVPDHTAYEPPLGCSAARCLTCADVETAAVSPPPHGDTLLANAAADDDHEGDGDGRGGGSGAAAWACRWSTGLLLLLPLPASGQGSCASSDSM